MKKIVFILITLLICTANLTVKAQNNPPLTRVLFILDGSSSMLEVWDRGIKFYTAQQLLTELLDSLSGLPNQDNIQYALRVFGHQSAAPPEDCNDTKLEVPFGYNNSEAIIAKIESIKPKGTTPIARSLLDCANDFPDCDNCRNIVILITDGMERCGGDPCEVSIALQKQGIILKPYIIGIRLDTQIADYLSCIGNYFDVGNADEFADALNTVISEVTNLTSVQINLLDIYGNPTETNVALSFHDNLSGNIRYTFMHTMNDKGQPDTLHVDIMSVYDLKVHTIPPVYLDTLIVQPKKLNVFEVPAPQGSLKVVVDGNDPDDNDVKCIVRQTGLMETIHVLDAEKEQYYIVGLYNLEVLTLPRIYIDAVEVKQDVQKTLRIAQPGRVIINFKSPVYGSLLFENGDVLTNIYDFIPDRVVYNLRLQPGYYRIIFRDKNQRKTEKSLEQKVRVKSGETYIFNL
ncbi:MAG: VWA domain-containing protein [Bacteroidales bacterium]|nr:VWA domain-containing protein [Bacteroidales bacterium]HOY38658.1 VWA domain-containing protein [Bacteroidales bacterium]HQP03642.1 VWA domain-containing protein [Bacteroidales bacterium]